MIWTPIQELQPKREDFVLVLYAKGFRPSVQYFNGQGYYDGVGGYRFPTEFSHTTVAMIIEQPQW